MPFGTVFSGMLLNLFTRTNRQQIVQRILGVSSLAEGLFRLLDPMYLIVSGLAAFALPAGQDVDGSGSQRSMPRLLTCRR